MTEIFIDPAQAWGGTDPQGRPVARLPIFARLPWDAAQYRSADLLHECEADPALWLTTPWDELLGETRDRLDAFWDTHLNPATAQSAALDWLGMVMGFTEDFWDVTWGDDFKRFLLSNALGGNLGEGGGAIAVEGIWADRGTQATIDAILAAYPIAAYGDGTFQVADFQAGMAVSHTVWAGDLTYFVRLPWDTYRQGDRAWKDAQRFTRNYGPACTRGIVQHSYFRADFSAADHAVFWREYELSQDAANDFAATYPGDPSDRPLDYLAALLAHLVPLIGVTATIRYRTGFYAGETLIPYRLYPFVEALLAYAPDSGEWRSLLSLIAVHRPFLGAAVASQSEFVAGVSMPGHLLGGPRPEFDHADLIAGLVATPQPLGAPPDAIALEAHAELLDAIATAQPLPITPDPDWGLRAGFMVAGDEISTAAARLWVEAVPTITADELRYFAHTDHAIRPYPWTALHYGDFTAGLSAAGQPLTRNPNPSRPGPAEPYATAINTAELQATATDQARLQAIADALCYPVAIAQLGGKLWALCSSAIPQGSIPWAVMGWALSRFAGDVPGDLAWNVFLSGKSLAGHPCFPVPSDPENQAIGTDCLAALTTDASARLLTSDLPIPPPPPPRPDLDYAELIATFEPTPLPVGTPVDVIALESHSELLGSIIALESLPITLVADWGLRAGFMVAGDEITTDRPRLWVRMALDISRYERDYAILADEAIRSALGSRWALFHYVDFVLDQSAAGQPLTPNPNPARPSPVDPWATAINVAIAIPNALAPDRIQAIADALGYAITITLVGDQLWVQFDQSVARGSEPWAVMGWALSRFGSGQPGATCYQFFWAGTAWAGHPIFTLNP
jgi:hypothetical protein